MAYDRIITHSDFDGLVSGALCSVAFGVDSFVFAGPNTINRAEISTGPGDIVCDLPYPLECGLWFDHHPGSREALALRGIKAEDIPGRLDDTGPSCARVVLEYLGGGTPGAGAPPAAAPLVGAIPPYFAETVAEADTIDSFDYRSVEEWRRETPGKLVDMSIKAYFATPRDQTKYLQNLVRLVRDRTLAAVPEDAEVAANIARYREEEKRMLAFIEKSVSFLPEDPAHEIIVLDFTAHAKRPRVVKNLAYMLHPGALAALTVSSLYHGERKTNDLSISMSLSMNMTGREHGKDVGEIMRSLDIGDGHVGAAAGIVHCDSKDAMLRRKKRLLADIWRLWKGMAPGAAQPHGE